MAVGEGRAARLEDGEVHLWSFDLPADRLIGRKIARERALSIISGYLGLAPAEVRLELGRRGKPSLTPDERLSFNLSHAGSKGLLAVTSGSRVGVDIEALRPLLNPIGLARRFFSPLEADALAASSDPLAAFFRVWVRKEAYLKGLGKTVPAFLSRFSVTVEGNPRVISTRLEPGGTRFTLADIRSPGYAAALAVEGEIGRIKNFRLGNTPGGT